MVMLPIIEENCKINLKLNFLFNKCKIIIDLFSVHKSKSWHSQIMYKRLNEL